MDGWKLALLGGASGLIGAVITQALVEQPFARALVTGVIAGLVFFLGQRLSRQRN